MTAIVTRCRQCGTDFEHDADAIRVSSWRLCPGCQPQPDDETRCERCERVLRGHAHQLCSVPGGAPVSLASREAFPCAVGLESRAGHEPSSTS